MAKNKVNKNAEHTTNTTNHNNIEIVGARMHNLKNVSVTIPRNQLVVITGVSGSGKSSLAIDTLFAEGQRRYAESLNAYARQFISRMEKPDVDYIKGICPAIAIEQKVVTRTPRSTVGSMTEIYDYLKLLYARIGKTYSPVSGKEVRKDDITDVINAIQLLPVNSKVQILIALKIHAHRTLKEELNILQQKGFTRVILYNQHNFTVQETINIQDAETLTEKELQQKILLKDKNILPYVIIDRIVVKAFEEEDIHRLSDSISTAFYEGEGQVFIDVMQQNFISFNNKFEADGLLFEEPSPNLFSFNNPYGACSTCEGFSQVLGIDKNLVIPNPKLSVYEGAVAPWKGEKLIWWKEQFIQNAKKFPIHKPIEQLTEEELNQLWNGVNTALGINDFFKDVEANLYKVQFRVLLSRYRGRTTCPTCNGYRLRPEALYVKINNQHIGQLCQIPVIELQQWFKQLSLTQHEQEIAKRIFIEITQRVDTLVQVGLGYLTLNRLANSLSGGESQRIQITRSLGSNLTDSLYILDEPSIGLHNRDTENLIKVLQNLRNLGNTVLVVEHDELIMKHADHIIDMGPLASHLGGQVVAQGNYQQILDQNKSLTAKYLSGEMQVAALQDTRNFTQKITVHQASENNLKNITVSFPLNTICVITGVSGSGKTTLVKQVLVPALQKALGEFPEKIGKHSKIDGDISGVQHIEMIDQNPIGKSSRSNPVTYIKAYDDIRDLYAKQPLSKIRGFMPKHFSFNVDGGRCDTCKGEGEQTIEMQFLADVHLLCESCKGKRFKEEVLEVTFNGKNIDDILQLSVDDAIDFFASQKTSENIAKALKPLQDVGLGYVKLGQSSNTLSGGEAQRIKLASFLQLGKGHGHILFVFDEPTTGLHFNDIAKLLKSFNDLVNQGHSLIIIEHNSEVIKHADWLIDLGPEAGDKGGNLVYAGIPMGIKKVKESYTAKYF